MAPSLFPASPSFSAARSSAWACRMTTSSPSPPATTRADHAPSQKSPRPPEWPLERLLKTIGNFPAAAGRFLDRLARRPLIGPPVRFFSSVWLGILWLLLLGLYIGVGSGLPSMRAKLEMTDLQFFDAWPMRIILAGLALTLTVVTLRRIPLTLFKLGVWTVHIGILTLITGAVCYFPTRSKAPSASTSTTKSPGTTTPPNAPSTPTKCAPTAPPTNPPAP